MTKHILVVDDDAHICDVISFALEKADNAGKKVSGIKRHITLDINGLPHAMAV